MKLTGTIRAPDMARGAVRVEDVYDIDIKDLWEACTTPERVERWIAQVSGDLRVGGTVRLVFTSTWAGAGRIEVCDAPHHLRLVTEPGTDDEGLIEAWLTAEGSRTRMVVEERAIDGPTHQDGWSEQQPAPGWHARWSALTPAYQDTEVG